MSYGLRHTPGLVWSGRVMGDLQRYARGGSVVLVTGQCSVTIGVSLGVGNIMRKVIIRLLAATAVAGGLLFGSTGVAAANPAPTAKPSLAQPTPSVPTCPLGTFLDSMGLCMAF